jgi:MoaA/NifB/PqqE/SkfB family radical SAM enzyme
MAAKTRGGDGMLHDAAKKIRYSWSFLKRDIVHVNLQLLYSCNFSCSICDFWKETYASHPRLSLSQVKVIAEKLGTIGPQVISIGGGEPLMHEDIIPIAQELAKNNFAVMISNGWFVTPDIARSLFRAGMYEVSISIDYADPAKHDAQRGKPGAFNRAVEALKTLNENRAYPHQRVHMISVIMDDNIDDIEELIRISRDLGITYLLTLYSDNRGRKAGRYPDRDVSAHLLSLKKKYREFVVLRGYIARFSEAIERGGISPCHTGRNLINIDSQGNVTFCIDRLEDPAGNILTDDIRDIRGRLARGSGNNACTGCWTSCRGSIESLMYGKNKLENFFDYYMMTKNVALPRGNPGAR